MCIQIKENNNDNLSHSKIAWKYNLSEQEFREVLFKTCINGKISNAELVSYIYLADKYKLNSLEKEIYAAPKKVASPQLLLLLDGLR
ncbi:hypothetical protein [Bartonella bovis]|uniref:hypothetical protein n=1 Tax=Bartonella bovis TaxID=155194 RepID=UPI00039F5DB2|nr:hypothetical protein [Bartonella bovis]